MSWFRVDDSFHSHPKILELLERRCGMAAAGLWVLSGSLASAHDDFGSISRAALRRLRGTKAQAEALVSVGLWERDGDGYRFHDWEDYRPPPRKPEDPANVNRRVRKHRQKKRERNAALQERETVPPVPTRPDPSVTRPNGIGERGGNSPSVSRPPDGRALARKLGEALSHSQDAPTPPWRDTGQTQRRSQLRPTWDATGALMAEIVASTGGADEAVAEVLASLEGWARLADRGLVDAASWKEGHLLTPNGYRRMVREVENGGDPKLKPDVTRGSYQPSLDDDYGPTRTETFDE